MRLDGGRAKLDAWLASTPVERHQVVYDALFSIVDGTWPARFRHWDDLVRRGVALDIGAGEVLVWRQYVEYPDRFRVLYIGRID